jgi:hypothetical protein
MPGREKSDREKGERERETNNNGVEQVGTVLGRDPQRYASDDVARRSSFECRV